MARDMSKTQRVGLYTLPTELFHSILKFLPLEELPKLIAFNEDTKVVYDDVLLAKASSGGPAKVMHLACSLGCSRVIRNLVEERGISPSMSYDYQDLPYTATNNGRLITGPGEPMYGSHLMHPLLTAGTNDQLGAFTTLLDLGASPLKGMPEETVRFTRNITERYRFKVLTKDKERFVRVLVQYEHGRRLLNMCWDWAPLYEFKEFTLPEKVRAAPITAIILLGVSRDVIVSMLENSDDLNRLRTHLSLFEPFGVLAAILSLDNQDDAEVLMDCAMANGADVGGASIHWVSNTAVKRVTMEQSKFPKISTTMSVPIFMAAMRMAKEGLRWPMEACLHHGADVNQDVVAILKMHRNGYMKENRELVKLTPILVYLLSIPWWIEDGNLAHRVLDDVNYLLERGAYLTQSSGTEPLENKWKQQLMREYQWRKVVCYSPVELLLSWWRVEDESKHVLRWGCCFDVVRGLIEMGCDGPRRRSDRDVYGEICRERGIDGIGDDGGEDDGILAEILRELQLGYDI